MRIIAVMSPKGGIGKTTTSDSIAYMLGEEQGKRVLAFPFFFFLSHYKQERKVKGCRNKHFVDLQQLQASLEKQWGVF